MTEHVITVEHTRYELVREFRLNEPLDCAPSLWQKLRMLFSGRARRMHGKAEHGYAEPFYFVGGVANVFVSGDKLIIGITPDARWEDVQPGVIRLLRESQYWHYNDAIRIKNRAPSV